MNCILFVIKVEEVLFEQTNKQTNTYMSGTTSMGNAK